MKSPVSSCSVAKGLLANSVCALDHLLSFDILHTNILRSVDRSPSGVILKHKARNKP